MDYLQVDIYTTTAGIDPVGAMLIDVGAGGFAVQDAADFAAFLENKTGNWEYIEDSLMALLDAETTLSAYLPENEQGAQRLSAIEEGLRRLQTLDIDKEWGRLTFAVNTVREQDWAEAWKQYYRPVKVGKRMVVCPSWEQYLPQEGEIVLQMDPGMAFGTGTHASTRLCLRLLEEQVTPETRMLDMGCGSGILAVSALLMGAKEAMGVDIDAVAVRVAQENALRNHVENGVHFVAGNLADVVTGSFNLICANIVADVIISFAADAFRLMESQGTFIVSGIIDEREGDVVSALEQQGFVLKQRMAEEGWVALAWGK